MVMLLERDVLYDPYSAACVVTPGIYVPHPWEQEEANEGRRCKVGADAFPRPKDLKLSQSWR